MNDKTFNVLYERAQGPARHFAFPHEVVDDPSFSAKEKRAILCEWASDACAVPSFPILRLLPGTTFPVTFSSVMDALAQLDRKQWEYRDERSGRGRAKGSAVVREFRAQKSEHRNSAS